MTPRCRALARAAQLAEEAISCVVNGGRGYAKEVHMPESALPSWSNPVVLAAIEQAFDSTWPLIQSQAADLDKARTAELNMALSHRLVELAAGGVIDPEELQRLALETFQSTASPDSH